MVLYYKFKREVIKMNVKSFININDFNNKRIQQSLKLSLTKKYNISLDDFLINEMNKEIKKCGICGHYSYYDLDFIFDRYKDSYLIKDVIINYNHNFYCKGKNKNCKGKKMNSNSVEFVSLTMNLSKEESLKYIHDRNSSPFYKENHKSINDYKNYQKRDINFFKSEEKYNEYKNKISYRNSKQRYIDEYGNDKGTEIFDNISKLKDNSSFNYFLRKNNNDKGLSYFEYTIKNNKCKQVLSNFVFRYGIDGYKKYEDYNKIRKQCTSKEHFVKLYGNDGIKKRNKWLNKKRINNFYSKESFEIFEKINEELKLNGFFGKNEYFLKNKEKNICYFYDYTLLDKKKIIEYNGRIWHPNKDIYSDEEWDNWKHPINKELKANDIYNKDIDKLDLAKNNGFDVLVIWDFENDKIDKIKRFIND